MLEQTIHGILFSFRSFGDNFMFFWEIDNLPAAEAWDEKQLNERRKPGLGKNQVKWDDGNSLWFCESFASLEDAVAKAEKTHLTEMRSV